MALIVETGAGLSNAEAYVSVAAADARMTSFGNDTWATLTTAEREEAIRRSTTHMVQAYRGRWAGQRVNSTQALDWPRWGVEVDGFYVASDSVPADIANACADLAFKAAAGDLAPDLTRGVVRKKVGPLETEYDRNSPQATRYRSIDMTLAPYLTGSAAMATLVRA
jgi:Putative DnaT-like ssDNA binding protein